jgi:phage tail sheath protein FI
MNSPKVIYNETDLSTQFSQTAAGISAVLVATKGGPIGHDGSVITTWEQFKQTYGGFIDADDRGVLQVKRALEGGSALRISRLAHYTDITDRDSHDMDFAAQAQTNIFVFAANIAAGHTIQYAIGADSVSQVFDTSSQNTLELLAAKIIAGFGAVQDVRVLSATKFIVIPSGAAIVDVVTPSGVGAPAVTRTTTTAIRNADDETIFTLAPKYPGEYYNNIIVYINSPSNGQAGYFDLVIEFDGESDRTERYRNLKITGAPTVAQSDYLSEVVKKSKLVNVTYSDLSAIATTPIVPIPFTLKMNAGSDGSAIDATDYVGDSSAKNGLYSFDGVDDVAQIAILAAEDALADSVHVAGAAYAEARKDLQYFGFIDGDTEADVITNKDALGVDSSYAMFFAGKIKVIDPFDGVEKIYPPMGDILGMAARSEKLYGLWYSFSGPNRGKFQNTLGASNAWGSAGNATNLDLLANHQVNVVITRNTSTVLWGSFTGQLGTSQLSLANVRRFHIFLKKKFGPVLENFLEEQNDIPTWKMIYLAVKSDLDTLVNRRAMFSYRWEGDQFARSLDDLVINNSADVLLGKYKVRLFVKDIASMQEFSIDITLTPGNVSFEDALQIVEP